MEHTPHELEFKNRGQKWTARIVQQRSWSKPWISKAEVEVIKTEVESMLHNHPELLAGRSLCYRYNQYRVFIFPSTQRPCSASPTTPTNSHPQAPSQEPDVRGGEPMLSLSLGAV